MTTLEDEAKKAAELVDRIRPLLAGVDAAIQGVVLADCMAMWLAGHHVPGNEDATRRKRAELLAMHCFAVRQLVPLSAAMLGTTP